MRRPRVVAASFASASLASAVFAIGLVASAEPPAHTPDQLVLPESEPRVAQAGEFEDLPARPVQRSPSRPRGAPRPLPEWMKALPDPTPPPVHWVMVMSTLQGVAGPAAAGGAALGIACNGRPGTTVGDPAAAVCQFLGFGFFGAGVIMFAGSPMFGASAAAGEGLEPEERAKMSQAEPVPPSPWLVAGGATMGVGGIAAGFGILSTLSGGDPWSDERGVVIGAGLGVMTAGIPMFIGGLVHQSRLTDIRIQHDEKQLSSTDVVFTGTGIAVRHAF